MLFDLGAAAVTSTFAGFIGSVLGLPASQITVDDAVVTPGATVSTDTSAYVPLQACYRLTATHILRDLSCKSRRALLLLALCCPCRVVLVQLETSRNFWRGRHICWSINGSAHVLLHFAFAVSTSSSTMQTSQEVLIR